MKTIENVFSENLRRLRGSRSQAVIAEMAGIHTVVYQRMEAGTIPHRPNLDAVVRALGLSSELELFIDLETTVPREAVAIQDGLTELFEKFPKLDDIGRTAVLNTLRFHFDKLRPQKQNKIDSLK